MTETILSTKLYIPSIRPELVRRSRLVERLNAGKRCKLTLISAPAGFGKTTVVTEWLNGLQADPQNKIAWLSLDDGDNNPARFLTYLAAAFKQIDTGDGSLGEEMMGLLQASQLPPVETALTLLINQISAVGFEIIFVLDDYHLIEAQAIHDAVNYLLEHLPPQVHLVIASREDPQLPLARLRVQGQLTELRAMDLRFTSGEAAEFLKQAMGLDLSDEDIRELEERTEGWIAGLQLAAISMQGHDDVSGLIRSFSGSHRFVLDYLLEEVMKKQPENIKAFLLQTAVLERMCGSLCDALTGQDNGQETLEMLERANLFIIPMDNERQWYRYHHLFADLLRMRIASQIPTQVEGIHASAARWYEANGFLMDAIQHAFAGEDISTALRLIEIGALEALARSDFKFIFNAVSRLPEASLRDAPWLFVYHTWALLLTGQLDLGSSNLEDTDWLLGSLPDDQQTEKQKMLGFIAGLKSVHSSWQRDNPATFDYAGQAKQNLPLNHWVIGYCQMAVGTAFWGDGDLAGSVQAFSEAASIGKAVGNRRVMITASGYLGHTLELSGKLRQAVEHYKRSFQLVQRNGKDLPGAIYIYAEYARVLYELNELDLANQLIEKGIEQCRRMGDGRVENMGHYLMVRVHAANGDLDSAARSIQDGQRAHPGTAPALDMRGIEFPQVWLWLKQDKYKEVEAWLKDDPVDLASISFFKVKLIYTMHARAMIALGREWSDKFYLEEAHKILGELHDLVEKNGWRTKLVEVLALQALCLDAQGDMKGAITVLEKVLEVSEPDGFVRKYVDEGPEMQALLKKVRPEDERLKRYISKLLAAFGDKPTPEQPLIEPLSERELEVLGLMATGLTNPEIASQLYLSLNTVKVHTRNIYQKLNTNNRTQAAAKARELGLLSTD